MKLTEKILLENYTGLTNGLDIISNVDGQDIFWNYRTDYISRTDGYCPVSSRQRADAIYLDYNRSGRIELDGDIDRDSLPGASRLDSDFEKALGVEV